MKSALIIGGYGGFGARLARRLDVDGWHLIIAGRSAEKADAMASTLQSAKGIRLDRSGDIAPCLEAHTPFLLIDAAGPFQDSDYRVPEACCALGVHYLDLADARAFVTDISAMDARARDAGVAVISGASSVPALSGAVLRDLTQDCEAVTRVDMAISASDKASAGTSVASAILSYVGQKLRIWQGQRWGTSHGWQQVERIRLKTKDGTRISRLVALADVPDLDLVPASLPGKPATRFSAGPEFGFQVVAMWLLSWTVRWGWLRSLIGLRRLLLPLQKLTQPFSDGNSFMTVRACVKGSDGFEKRAWHLIAKDGNGPEIPLFAAQLLANALAGAKVTAGARAAHEELTLAQFEPLFSELDLETSTSAVPYIPLYKRVLGDSFERLPKAVRDLHLLCGDAGAQGSATVTRGTNIVARLISAIIRFPEAGEHQLHLEFREDHGREKWIRDFSGRRFHSVLAEVDGHLTERFGPLRFTFDLPVSEQGLEMQITRWTAFGIPMPMMLAPRVKASETQDGEDFIFDVAMALPLIGDLVHYKGRLRSI